MESDTPEPDYFNEWVEAQTPERLERIVSRAQGDVLSEDEIGDQLALAYVEDTFRALEHKGVIEPDGVDADGEIIWGATTSGKSSSMALTGAEASVYIHFNKAEADERNQDEPTFDMPAQRTSVGTRIIAWTKAQVLPGSRSA